MNIAETFNRKKEIEEQFHEVQRQQRVRDLANRIITELSEPEIVESLENYLAEHGSVNIRGFGCLCQDGFCTWQKGLSELVKPLRDEWKKKGINVRLGIELNFSVDNGQASHVYKKTLPELKEWYKKNQVHIEKNNLEKTELTKPVESGKTDKIVTFLDELLDLSIKHGVWIEKEGDEILLVDKDLNKLDSGITFNGMTQLYETDNRR